MINREFIQKQYTKINNQNYTSYLNKPSFFIPFSCHLLRTHNTVIKTHSYFIQNLISFKTKMI